MDNSCVSMETMRKLGTVNSGGRVLENTWTAYARELVPITDSPVQEKRDEFRLSAFTLATNAAKGYKLLILKEWRRVRDSNPRYL